MEERDPLTGSVIGCAIEVHRELGPGLLESVYEACLEHELKRVNLRVERQLPIPIVYHGLEFDISYRLDLVVENKLIIELKSVEMLIPLHEAQLLTYLRLSKIKTGLLINFNSVRLIDGLKRFVL